MRRGAEERLMCCCLVRARVYSAGGRGRGGDSVEHVYKRDPHQFAKEYIEANTVFMQYLKW